MSVAACAVAIWATSSARDAADDAELAQSRANTISERSLELALEESRQRIALHVFLGELPAQYQADAHPIWAVTNASPVDVTQVWVDGTQRDSSRAYIRVGSVQRCHIYTLHEDPGDFFPTELHFYDGRTHWKRDFDGKLSVDKRPSEPGHVARLPSPAVYEVRGSCGS